MEQTGGLHVCVCAWLNKHDLMEINPYPIAKNYGAGRYYLFICEIPGRLVVSPRPT